MEKVDILAVGVHPDDIELSCCGVLFKEIDAGKTVGMLDLTQGELGTRGNAKLRLQEAEKAANIIGAKFRVNLGMPDGFLESSRENLLAIVQIIRACKPKLVLANAVHDRHPDHGKAAKLTSDACFLSGLVKIQTQWKGNPQEHWRPKAVYHYIQDYELEPDFVVDISDYIDKKMEAIMAFGSQFYNPESKEPESPISSRSFMEFIKAKGRRFGRPIGVEFAEGFTVNRTVGVNSLFDLL